MSGQSAGGTEQIEVSHQATVVTKQWVGTEGSSGTVVDNVRTNTRLIHPDLAERLEDEFGIDRPQVFGLEVVDR